MGIKNGIAIALVIFGSSYVHAQTTIYPDILKLYLPAEEKIPVFIDLPKKIVWEKSVDVITKYSYTEGIPSQRKFKVLTLDTDPYSGLPSVADGKAAIDSGRFDHEILVRYSEKLTYLLNHPELGLPQLIGQSDDQYSCIKLALDGYRSCIYTNWDGKVEFPNCVRQHVAVNFQACCVVPKNDGTPLSPFEKGLCTKQTYPWTSVLADNAISNDPTYELDLHQAVKNKINYNIWFTKRTESTGTERTLLNRAEAFQKSPDFQKALKLQSPAN